MKLKLQPSQAALMLRAAIHPYVMSETLLYEAKGMVLKKKKWGYITFFSSIFRTFMAAPNREQKSEDEDEKTKTI